MSALTETGMPSWNAPIVSRHRPASRRAAATVSGIGMFDDHGMVAVASSTLRSVIRIVFLPRSKTPAGSVPPGALLRGAWLAGQLRR